MKKNIIERTIKESEYMIKTQATIRDLSKQFKVSKSTVHKDLSERLIEIDLDKYNKVNSILRTHLENRHIKGGESTKKKYKSLK